MNAQERAEAAPKMLFLQIGDDGLAHPTECADTAEVRRAVEAAIYMPGTELDDGESRMLDEITSELLEDGESRFEGDPPLLLFRLAGRAALAAAPQVPAVPQWRPIETAPMHKAVLLWWRTCLEPAIGRYVSDERGEGWKCDGDQAIPRNQGDCTHWMPLPAAPGAPQPAEPAPTNDDALAAVAKLLLPVCGGANGTAMQLAAKVLRAAGVKEPGNAELNGSRSESDFNARLGG